MGTGTWETGDKPAQESPEIDQEQSEAQYKEAKSWIAGGGLDADSAQNAIGRLNAKAKSVALVDLLRLPVETENHEELP